MLSLNFTPFPTLYTKRLILRVLTVADAPELFKIRTDPEVIKYTDIPLAKAVTETEGWLANIIDGCNKNDLVMWAIAFKYNDRLLGTVGCWNFNHDDNSCDIGYMLNTAYHRRGIMTEALNEVYKYGFEKVGLRSIKANVHPENEASVKLIEKSGFIPYAGSREDYTLKAGS